MAAVCAAASIMTMTGIAAMAAEQDTVSQPVVDIEETVAPDPFIDEMTIIWYDEAGNEYRRTIRPEKKEEEQAPEIHSTVTWEDGAGNKYVLDGDTNIVTVYDSDGNKIAEYQK